MEKQKHAFVNRFSLITVWIQRKCARCVTKYTRNTTPWCRNTTAPERLNYAAAHFWSVLYTEYVSPVTPWITNSTLLWRGGTSEGGGFVAVLGRSTFMVHADAPLFLRRGELLILPKASLRDLQFLNYRLSAAYLRLITS
jgi:hypothetical protein